MEQIKEHLKEAIDYFDQGDKETAQQKIDEAMTQEIQSRLFNETTNEAQMNESLIGIGIVGMFGAAVAGIGWRIFRDYQVKRFLKQNYQRSYEEIKNTLENLETISDVKRLDEVYENFMETVRSLRNDIQENYPDHEKYDLIMKTLDRAIEDMEKSYEENKSVITKAENVVNSHLEGMPRRIQRWHRMNQSASSVDEIEKVENEFDQIMEDFDTAIDEIRNLDLNEVVRRRAIDRIKNWKNKVREQLRSAQNT